MDDYATRLARQCAVSRLTFGPGERREGILNHMRKEIGEVRSAESDIDRAREWVDLVILAQDGLMRCLRTHLSKQVPVVKGQDPYEHTNDQIATMAFNMITHKMSKNELRDWPDWRKMTENDAIEHKRGKHD